MRSQGLGLLVAFAALCALCAVPSAGAAGAADPIRLKYRTFTPVVRADRPTLAFAGVDRGSARHLLVQFRAAPDGQVRQAMERMGVEFIDYLSPQVWMVKASPAALEDPAVAAWVGWAGGLLANDKIARAPKVPLNPNSPAAGYAYLAQSFHDVSWSEACAAVSRAGAQLLLPDFFGRRYLLVAAGDDALRRLAAEDAVCWIMPAPEALLRGERVYLCPGLLTEFGYQPEYLIISDGWDGPGLGSAALTYFFLNGTEDIAGTGEQTQCIRAMNEWATYAAITWSLAASAGRSYSVDIGWFTGAHGDDDPFDGPGGVLAHAFYPHPSALGGDMHFDDDDTWEVGNPGPGFDLFSVALHELGHSLGLGHSDVSAAVMYPYISPSLVFTGLQSDDIAGIRAIYATQATPPTAAFTATPLSGTAPLAVQFTDQSSGSPTSWSWAFGDGGMSSQRNPLHTYQSPGVYSVALIVSNSAGSDSHTAADYITVSGTITISMPLNEAGWNLITLPGEPVNPDPAAVFDELVALGELNGSLYRYLPGVGYQAWLQSEPAGFGGPIESGEGYWLYVYGPVTITYDAFVDFAPRQIDLAQVGWHLIGSGQTGDIAMSTCTVSQGGGAAVPFASQTTLWITDPLYGWSIGLGGYFTCGVDVMDSDDSLRTFSGYWSYALLSDVTMYVPAP